MKPCRTNAEIDALRLKQQAELDARDPLLQQETHWMWLYLGGPILAISFVVGSIVIIRAVLELMIVLTRIATR